MSACVLDAVIDDHQGSCCGSHTVLRHGQHQGYLVGDGRLFCDTGSGSLQKCSLQWSSEPCSVVMDLEGHKHGPDCGHEAVPHGDHVDFLVDGELHHIVTQGTCCQKNCVSVDNQKVVRHGLVEIIKKGKAFITSMTSQKPHYQQLEIIQAKPEIVTTSRIVAEGICCPSEVPVIQRTLNPLPGVYSVDVSVVTKTVVVEHDSSQVSPGVLVSALNGANLSASLAINYKINQDLQKTSSWRSWIPPIHILICFFLLLLSLISYAGGKLEHFKWIALGSIAVGIWPIVLKAYGAVRACFVDMHILMTLAVVGAIAIGEYAEGAAVVFLFGLADWLEGKCTKHASNALAAVLCLQPDTALLKHKAVEVEADKVNVGQIVVVKPGCKVPIDGVVERGETLIDESMLTGESQPVFKVVGDTVMSGTLNTGAQAIDVCTSSLAVDSTASRIGKLIEEASRKKAPAERIVNNVAKYYTPLLLVATVLVIVIPLILKVDDSKEWITKGLVLLVSACPCAMVLSTPVTVVCGLARAAQNGVVIKGAQYLEALGRCQFMSFDKTGTLTRGQVELVHVGVAQNCTRTQQEIVQLAASLESHSSHPLANAVLGYAAAKGYNNWVSASMCESIGGQGIRGELVGGKRGFVGNQNMVKDVCGPQIDYSTVHSREENGETIVFVGQEAELWGYLALKDQTRKEAKLAINEIKKFGIQIGMMTGDSKLVANHIANEVGIEQQYVGAELLPQRKLDLVESVKKTHKICHVGDGVNDGPALAAADVGVAMGVAGSAVAIEAADIALFTSDLRQLAFALRLSRSAVQTIFINVLFSISIKLAVIALAFTIGVNLWLAVLADVGSCITVILHSMTILYINSSTDKKGTKLDNSQHSCCAGKSHGISQQLGYNDSCCDVHTHNETVSIFGTMQKSDQLGCADSCHDHVKCCSNTQTNTVVEKKKCCGSMKNVQTKTDSCLNNNGSAQCVNKAACCGSQECELPSKQNCFLKNQKSSCSSKQVSKDCCNSETVTNKQDCFSKAPKTPCSNISNPASCENQIKKQCCGNSLTEVKQDCCSKKLESSCGQKKSCGSQDNGCVIKQDCCSKDDVPLKLESCCSKKGCFNPEKAPKNEVPLSCCSKKGAEESGSCSKSSCCDK